MPRNTINFVFIYYTAVNQNGVYCVVKFVVSHYTHMWKLYKKLRFVF